MRNYFLSFIRNSSAAALILLLGIQALAQFEPCDDKTVMECGVEYTAVLEPDSGYWLNYTDLPYDYPGSEKVWEFTAPYTGAYIFYPDQGTMDADFFLMTDCSNEAVNITNFYWTGEYEQYINLEEGVTYYIIADLYSSATGPTTVSLKVECPGEANIPYPDYECYMGDGIASTVDEGLNVDPQNAHIKIADDFTVEAGTELILQQITMDTNQIEVPDHATINIRKDDNGIPGEIVETLELDTTSSEMWAVAFDEPVYHLVFDLPEAVTLAEGTYWLEPKLTTPNLSTVWWSGTENGSNGSEVLISEDGGISWDAYPNTQMIFFVAGECSMMGVNDISSSEVVYYPNPVQDVLTVHSQKALRSIEVYSMDGKTAGVQKNLTNGSVDLSGLAAGVYSVRAVLENGTIETFKVIKK